MARDPADLPEDVRYLLAKLKTLGNETWGRSVISMGLTSKAADLRRQADELENLAARIASGDLTIEPDNATVATMNASPTSDSLRSRAKLSKEAREHPFVAAFLARNETVAEVAAWLTAKLKRKVPRSTLQAWYRPPGDPGYRAIPKDAEQAIRERYKVPRSAWPRVIE